MLGKIENLLKNPTTLNKKILSGVLRFGIPFNISHKLKVIEIKDDHTIIEIPFIKKNKNHLGGQHACAIATVGEVTAGVNLMRFFSPRKYRFILSKLEVQYLYQGKTALQGISKLSLDKVNQTKTLIENEGKSLVEAHTEIYDQDKNLVANVQTIWQLKEWKKTSKN